MEQIAVRLDDRFRLLVGGNRSAPPRQKTVGLPTDVLVNGLRRAASANTPISVKTPTVGFSRLPIGSAERPGPEPARLETLKA